MKAFLLTLCASVMLVSGAHGHEAEAHLGAWIGTWQAGKSSGHFDLALQRSSDGTVTGNIVVSTDNQPTADYDVDLRNIHFEGDNFTAIFVTPGKSPDVVTLKGTLAGDTGSGEFVAHKRSQANTELSASGNWQLHKHVT